jgi:tetratricopeptide (TPR) repeat protein
MKSWSSLSLSIVCAAVVGGTVARWVTRASTESPALDVARLDSSSSSELARLSAENASLAARIEALERSVQVRAENSSRVGAESVDEAIARWFREHPNAGPTESAAAGAGAAPKSAAQSRREVQNMLGKLLDPNLSRDEKAKLWKDARESGMLDALVAEYEARAAADPNDPKLRVDLGEAYLQKIFAAGSNGPEAGLWATKADKAFDAALELDPHQWQGRFDKAVSLSFWPPIFGKQAEAIHNFEILLDEQASLPKSPEFAQTYLLLGNLDQQAGNLEKAKQVWQSGLTLFPENTDLAQKLAAFGH